MATLRQVCYKAAAPVCLLALVVGVGTPAPTALAAQSAEAKWVATWTAAPQLVEDANLPPAPGFGDATLRQNVRVSIGGQKIRVRFSNAFGQTALTLASVHVARSSRRQHHPESDGPARHVSWQRRP